MNPPITFLHIPKTGGISVLKWMHYQRLKDPSYSYKFNGDHQTLAWLKSKKPNDKFFVIVRNPWDRTVSMYHYIKHIYNKNGTWNESFTDFVRSLADPINPFVISQFEDISPEFLFPAERFTQSLTKWIDSPVDYTLRFENLNEDFKIIQNIFNTDESLLHLNSTEHSHYIEYYTDETRQMVEYLYADDIKNWNYEYGGRTYT